MDKCLKVINTLNKNPGNTVIRLEEKSQSVASVMLRVK